MTGLDDRFLGVGEAGRSMTEGEPINVFFLSLSPSQPPSLLLPPPSLPLSFSFLDLPESRGVKTISQDTEWREAAGLEISDNDFHFARRVSKCFLDFPEHEIPVLKMAGEKGKVPCRG